MRVWVMDNGLADRAGHHFNNSLAVHEACARAGLQTRFLAHRDAQPEVLAALAARPVFRFRPYELASRDALAGPMESLLVQAAAFAEGWEAAIDEGLATEDLVFVPTTLQNELYGCALALNQLAPEARPRLALNFMVENFFAPGTKSLGLIAPLYRYAARALGREIAAERLLLTANGEEMAQWITQVLARPVAVYPMPKSYPPQPPASRAGAVTCIAILGHSRREKGFQMVPEVVARHPQARFLVQVSPEPEEAMWQSARGDMRSAANVEIVRGALDPGAYHALMARADVVLLPYDPAQLPLRSSGVFSEAVAAGKVTVVPARTWMGAHLAAGRGAGVAFEAFDAESISAALGQAIARLAELQPQALARAAAWRSEQCMDAYLERALRYFAI